MAIADNQPVGFALATVDVNDKSAMLAELDVLTGSSAERPWQSPGANCH